MHTFASVPASEAYLQVSCSASLLGREGLVGCTGQAIVPAGCAAHAEVLLAAVAGPPGVSAPAGHPAQQPSGLEQVAREECSMVTARRPCKALSSACSSPVDRCGSAPSV